MMNLKVLILTIIILIFLIHPFLFLQIIEAIKKSFTKHKYTPKKINLFGKIIYKNKLNNFTFYSWIFLIIFVLILISPPTIFQEEYDCNYALIKNNFYNNCEETIQKYKQDVNILHGNQMILNQDGEILITVYGSYDDLNTKEVVRKILKLNQENNNKIKYSFINTEITEFSNIANCIYYIDAKKYWSYHTYIMTYNYLDDETHKSILQTLKLNETQLNECLNGKLNDVENEKNQIFIKESNIFAIPTTFVNNKIIIGNQPVNLP
ncbi:MAG: DsbA family protein [Candidatus Woesearchaeota archaeon]